MNSNKITTRRHQICHRLRRLLGEGKSPPVTSVSVAQLVAMLDCPHENGSAWALASKSTKAGLNATTVLDVPLGRAYRAVHSTGMVTFWKGVAKRRGPAVQLVRAEGTKAANGWTRDARCSGREHRPSSSPNPIAPTAPGFPGDKS
jgi:hypothetical protein